MNAAINGHPDAKSRMLMLNKMLEQAFAPSRGSSNQKTTDDKSATDRGDTANEKR